MIKVVDTLPSLEEQGIEQLYPSPPDPNSVNADGTQSEWTLDRAFYLQKMAKSLLLNFMELVGVLSTDPSQVNTYIPNYEFKKGYVGTDDDHQMDSMERKWRISERCSSMRITSSMNIDRIRRVRR